MKNTDAFLLCVFQSPRPSKLEKADILEMTVDYIKKIADRKPGAFNESFSIDCF